MVGANFVGKSFHLHVWGIILEEKEIGAEVHDFIVKGPW